VAARARRQPGRWASPALGLALAVAFAAAVATEATIAGDRAARATLAHVSPLAAAVSVIDTAPERSAAHTTDRRARRLLGSLGLPVPTRTILLNPVRLSGVVVRLAALDRLTAWTGRSAGACRTGDCPVIRVGGAPVAGPLRALGIHLSVALGSARLHSAAVLGFVPAAGRGQPLLVGGDVDGLAALPALSSLFRTESWVSVPRLSALHSWQLATLRRRLVAAQSSLPALGPLRLTAPTEALAAAHGRAREAGRRLLPAGGGAVAALAMFVVLAAYGLRRDEEGERDRLRSAGARPGQLLLFSVAEAGWLAAVSMAAGGALGVGAGAVLAAHAGLPVGAVLSHSLLTPVAAAGLAGGWAVAVALVASVLLLPGGRLIDALALAAAAALTLALIVGGGQGGGEDPALALLVAPLACLATAALVFRAADVVLRAGERAARRGPLVLRLALVGLARASTAPALAVAFVAVSTGLAGFALTYRATLARGDADEAAQQVPLDARVAPSASFTTPVALAGLRRWRALSGGGTVLPVRRTDASLPLGGETASLTALGVPAAGLTRIHGWRAGDGSAPLATLAARLAPRGPVRAPGPRLPASARELSVRAAAPDGEVALSAELRGRSGAVLQVPLGDAGQRVRTLHGRVPIAARRDGADELEALRLDEPTGAATLNGHQNGENPAAATRSSTTLVLGPVRAAGATAPASWQGWRGVGAAQVTATHGATARVSFDDSGQPGILRSLQPSDTRPVPVLTDRATAAAAGPGGALPLTVDGEPVNARVVGWTRRFPTIDAGQPGFVVADEATLDGALDAALPGQGRTDELWIDTPRPAALRRALATAPLRSLTGTFRSEVERSLRTDPVARGVMGTLVAAAAVSGALAILGLLTALAGAMRDRRLDDDLEVLGLGPRRRRREPHARVMAAALLGTGAGLLLAALLTRLVVAAVRAAGAARTPNPPLVAVAPWGELLLLALAAVAALALAAGVAARRVTARRETGWR
jgi:hypothetical protein